MKGTSHMFAAIVVKDLQLSFIYISMFILIQKKKTFCANFVGTLFPQTEPFSHVGTEPLLPGYLLVMWGA